MNLTLKDFESGLKSVTQDEMLAKRIKSQYLPFIQIILKKAKIISVGKSVEVDVKDPKQAMALGMAIRGYLKKTKNEEFVAGNYRTYVFCGRRNGSPEKDPKRK